MLKNSQGIHAPLRLKMERNSARHVKIHFYPTALKGCRGIVFTHGVRIGGRSGGWLGGGKKFVWPVSQKL